MPIPPFDKYGMLPPGVHDCGWQEMEAAFCWNPHRKFLFDELQRFLSAEWWNRGFQCPIIVDGSFVRGKEFPDDIDIIVEVSSYQKTADIVSTALVMKLLQRERIKAQYHVDFLFRYNPPNPLYDMMVYFQNVGDKAAAEWNGAITADYPKGILRVYP